MTYLQRWVQRKTQNNIQFPLEIVSKVTIYSPFTDPLTGNQIAVRCVLDGCFWNDDSITVFQKTGQQTSNSVTLYVPYRKEVTGREYITPNEWNRLSPSDLDKYWTVNPKQLPLMVKGEIDFEFEWATPTAPNRLAVQENNLMNANANIRRAKDINEELYGDILMWHILIRV